MNKISKMKDKLNIINIKILCVITAIVVFAAVVLTACERPDIYKLIENLLDNGGDINGNLYYFNADLNIKINKDNLYSFGMPPKFGNETLDCIPDELTFRFDGKVKKTEGKPSEFEITAEVLDTTDISDLSNLSETNKNLKTVIYGKNNLLYFELNDISRIVVNFLCAAEFLDIPVKTIFENQISYENGTVLCFDMTGIDFPWFDRYIEHIDSFFKVDSTVKYDGASAKDFSVPELNKSKAVYFSDIKSKTDKELLKAVYYRYSELHIILSSSIDSDGNDNKNNNYINILATREGGKTELLSKTKIDCDISKITKNPELLLSEKILPLRYILELLGETVGWDESNKKAYTVNAETGAKLYFEGSIINSKTYISLAQFLAHSNYGVENGTVGDYIEFKIFRK